MLAWLQKIGMFVLALWVIASVVFLLSRSLPGSAESRLFGAASETSVSAGQLEARQLAYRQYLQRTNQHLPLFYLSLSAAAESDTLYKIQPETNRQALKKLIFRYGNWPQISAFYQAVQHFQIEIRQNRLTDLYYFSEDLLRLALNKKAFETQLKNQLQKPENAKVERQLLQLQTAFNQLLATANPTLVYLPALHWHGFQNQYHRWLTNLLQLDLGYSESDKRPVSRALAEAFGNTLVLLLLSLGLAFGLAIGLSIWLVKTKNQKWQKPVLAFLYGLDSIPVFVVALILVLLLAGGLFLNVFPVYGLGETDTEGLTWLEKVNLHLYHIALPVICLVLATLPYLTAQILQALKATLQTDYIRTAKAKGLAENVIIWRHAFRNVWLPVITLLSDYLPGLVGGVLVIEVIFSIPGMGRLLAEAVLARDQAVITGVILAVAAFRLLCYLLADVFYFIADPRTRHTA